MMASRPREFIATRALTDRNAAMRHNTNGDHLQFRIVVSQKTMLRHNRDYKTKRDCGIWSKQTVSIKESMRVRGTVNQVRV